VGSRVGSPRGRSAGEGAYPGAWLAKGGALVSNARRSGSAVGIGPRDRPGAGSAGGRAPAGDESSGGGIMIIGRAIGWAFVVLGLLVLGRDVWVSVQAAAARLIAIGELWYVIDRSSLNVVQAVIQRYVWPPLWDPGIVTVLRLPAAPLLVALGAILLVAFRSSRRRKFF